MGKAVGAVLVLGACFLFAYAKVHDMKRKLHNAEQMERALFYLKHEVSFSARELWEVCDGLASFLEGQVGELFYRLGTFLKAHETGSFSEGWAEQVQGIFSPDAERVLSEFSRHFGTVSREQEEQAIDRCMECLQKIRTEEAEEYRKKQKLIYTLSICGGTSALILLV